ncbi:hypothetical protein CHR55_32375 [Rhodococcus qingshengii]|uniref:Uncharacterized protein n=1 Tax=Rhodococcus qingshengii TaxID=334542 RepID=A0A2A5IZ76_RHOSG|nr:hypothetical protein CHR55_32375 [Rhodococcus qingshengii]
MLLSATHRQSTRLQRNDDDVRHTADPRASVMVFHYQGDQNWFSERIMAAWGNRLIAAEGTGLVRGAQAELRAAAIRFCVGIPRP